MSPAGRPEIGKPINIRLPGDLLADLDTYAARFDMSRAEVIRQAVRQWLWDDEMARMGDADLSATEKNRREQNRRAINEY
jgi:metal-responsive CopG/Arc/MetJ family transcriptional regulator